MNNTKHKSSYIGIDLFSGAGGLSLGARNAGIDVVTAVEKDTYAAQTYAVNHPHTNVITDDICNVLTKETLVEDAEEKIILFGGPPCQGFSASNKRTRNKENPSNWLLEEFLRISRIVQPEWIVFENVHGFINTENQFFLKELVRCFEELNYAVVWYVLNAADFGVPQKRKRFFLIASRNGYYLNVPQAKTSDTITIRDALSDLPSLINGANIDILQYKCNAKSPYAKQLRHQLEYCTGHLVSRNAAYILERYNHIPQGGNWRNIPNDLTCNYADINRCHEGIYRRLNENEAALTIGNYRKSMLIHPWENRGLSVREAARIQSFPDDYIFMGSLGFQQQQVGNAVPPLLAEAIFKMIVNEEYHK